MPEPVAVEAADLDIATRTLAGEARGEPIEGQRAVAWVIRNRATWSPPTWWGRTVGDVCRKPLQFSCWNGGPDTDYINDMDTGGGEYKTLFGVVSDVFSGAIPDPTGGASHYERLGTGAPWAKGREFSKIIGRHAFYAIGPGA